MRDSFRRTEVAQGIATLRRVLAEPWGEPLPAWSTERDVCLLVLRLIDLHKEAWVDDVAVACDVLRTALPMLREAPARVKVINRVLAGVYAASPAACADEWALSRLAKVVSHLIDVEITRPALIGWMCGTVPECVVRPAEAVAPVSDDAQPFTRACVRWKDKCVDENSLSPITDDAEQGKDDRPRGAASASAPEPRPAARRLAQDAV